MSRDFRTNQIQVNKVIASGSTGTGAKILFYSIEADDSGSPNTGVINTSVFDTSVVGNDAFMYVSGGIGVLNSDTPGAAVFGGDVYVSGNFDVAGAIFDASASNVYNDSDVVADKVSDALNVLSASDANHVIYAGANTNQRIARWSGSSTKLLDNSDIRIDNDANMSGINELTASIVYATSHIVISQSTTAPAAQVDHAMLYLKHDNGTGGSEPNLFYRNEGGAELRLTRGNKLIIKNNATPATNALPKYTNTSGELLTPTSVIIDDSDNMSGINELTASVIANGAQYNGATLLSSSVGGTWIDAAAGPNYELELTEHTLFENPVNAVEGQELLIGIRQNESGSWSTLFDSNWIPVGQLEDIAQASGSYTALTALCRDFGDGPVWQYAFSHAETLTGLTDLDVSGSTTDATPLTVASVMLSADNMSGMLDFSVHAKITGSNKNAQFGMRSLIYRTGSLVTLEDENLYSSFDAGLGLTVTHSVNSLVVDIQVVGSASANIDWKLKGIFEEI